MAISKKDLRTVISITEDSIQKGLFFTTIDGVFRVHNLLGSEIPEARTQLRYGGVIAIDEATQSIHAITLANRISIYNAGLNQFIEVPGQTQDWPHLDPITVLENGNYLTMSVESLGGIPQIVARQYSIDGTEVDEDAWGDSGWLSIVSFNHSKWCNRHGTTVRTWAR